MSYYVEKRLVDVHKRICKHKIMESVFSSSLAYLSVLSIPFIHLGKLYYYYKLLLLTYLTHPKLRYTNIFDLMIHLLIIIITIINILLLGLLCRLWEDGKPEGNNINNKISIKVNRIHYYY